MYYEANVMYGLFQLHWVNFKTEKNPFNGIYLSAEYSSICINCINTEKKNRHVITSITYFAQYQIGN